MRAVLSEIINGQPPIIRTLEIDIETWRDYVKFLKCVIFTVVTINYKGETLSLFVDDEGLLKPNYGRMVDGYHEPLFGNIIVTGGVDNDGETLPLPENITVMEINNIISGVQYETI
jgi:hypothetical protein